MIDTTVQKCIDILSKERLHRGYKVVGKYILEVYGSEDYGNNVYIYPVKKNLCLCRDSLAGCKIDDYWDDEEDMFNELDSESKIESLLLYLKIVGGQVRG